MENDDAFSDLAGIAMGDFFQLSPIRPSETLCAAALNQLNGKVSMDPDKITTGLGLLNWNQSFCYIPKIRTDGTNREPRGM